MISEEEHYAALEASRISEHLKMLSVFHYVLGGLTMLFGLMPIMHVAMGVMLASGAFSGMAEIPVQMQDGKPIHPEASAQMDEATKVMGMVIIVFGAVFVVIGQTAGVLLIFAGRKIASRKSRTFCLVVAGFSCLLFPFGTVLGVFTIIILQKPSVVALFEGRGAGGSTDRLR